MNTRTLTVMLSFLFLMVGAGLGLTFGTISTYVPDAEQLLVDAGHWSNMKFSQKPSEFQKAMTREIKRGKIIWGVGHGQGIHYDLVLSFAKEWHELSESEKKKFLKPEKS